jgi:GTP-binding protein EngB required for normal cell division
MVLAFVLVGVSSEPQPIDLEFVYNGWGKSGFLFQLFFTKADKLKQRVCFEMRVRAKNAGNLGRNARYFVICGNSEEGRDELLGYIILCNSN